MHTVTVFVNAQKSQELVLEPHEIDHHGAPSSPGLRGLEVQTLCLAWRSKEVVLTTDDPWGPAPAGGTCMDHVASRPLHWVCLHPLLWL